MHARSVPLQERIHYEPGVGSEWCADHQRGWVPCEAIQASERRKGEEPESDVSIVISFHGIYSGNVSDL